MNDLEGILFAETAMLLLGCERRMKNNREHQLISSLSGEILHPI
jgi:hypothetical protein